MTIAPDPFTTPDPDQMRTIHDWLRTYVARPHPQLGRPGAVCPFIAPALRADAMRLFTYQLPGQDDTHPDGTTAADHLTGMLEQARLAFHRQFWPTRNRAHQALMVLLPGLRPEQWPLIDQMHAATKDRFVQDGLMLGQLHPDCPAPAVHNPDFAVNRAPIPLFAIRHMQVHDLLFLHTRPDWLAAYTQRFGHLHHGPGVLSSLYHEAHARHALADRAGA